jgi:hypothetical protein
MIYDWMISCSNGGVCCTACSAGVMEPPGLQASAVASVLPWFLRTGGRVAAHLSVSTGGGLCVCACIWRGKSTSDLASLRMGAAPLGREFAERGIAL